MKYPYLSKVQVSVLRELEQHNNLLYGYSQARLDTLKALKKRKLIYGNFSINITPLGSYMLREYESRNDEYFFLDFI